MAINTFRDLLRSRALLGFVTFGTVAICAFLPLGEMSLHNEPRVAMNGAYFVTVTLTLTVSVYSVLSTFFSDLEKRVIYTLLSKPIGRSDYFLGKFFGAIFVGTASLGVFTIVSLLVVNIAGGEFGLRPTVIFLSVCLQIFMISAVSLFVAARTTPIVAALGALGLYLLGSSVSKIEAASKFFGSEAPIMAYFLDGVALAAPDFESLTLGSELTYESDLPIQYFVAATTYSLVYTAVLLILAMMLFRGREIQ